MATALFGSFSLMCNAAVLKSKGEVLSRSKINLALESNFSSTIQSNYLATSFAKACRMEVIETNENPIKKSS